MLRSPAVSQLPTHNRDCWRRGKTLKSACRCTAAVLILWLRGQGSSWAAVFEIKETPLFLVVLWSYDSSHSTHTYTEEAYAHSTHSHRNSIRGCHKGVQLLVVCVVADSREGENTGLMMLYSARESGAG